MSLNYFAPYGPSGSNNPAGLLERKQQKPLYAAQSYDVAAYGNAVTMPLGDYFLIPSAAYTLTGADLFPRVFRNNFVVGFNNGGLGAVAQWPTAAEIVAGVRAQVRLAPPAADFGGASFPLDVYNPDGGVLTLFPNTGVTLYAGSENIDAGLVASYDVVLVSTTPGAERVHIYLTGGGAPSSSGVPTLDQVLDAGNETLGFSPIVGDEARLNLDSTTPGDLGLFGTNGNLDLYVEAASNSGANGADLYLVAGDTGGVAGTAAGDVFVTAGAANAGNTNNAGGSVLLTAGNGPQPGAVWLQAGTGTVGGVGSGGDILLQAGDGNGTAGGNVTVQGGTGSGGAPGGYVSVEAGLNGGPVQILGGHSSTASDAGEVVLHGGDNDGTGRGGAVEVTGGSASAAGQPAGNIILTPGNSNAASASAKLYLVPSANPAAGSANQLYGCVGIHAGLQDTAAPARFSAFQTTYPTTPAASGVVGPFAGSGEPGTAGVSSDMAGQVLVFGTGNGGDGTAVVTFQGTYTQAPALVLTKSYNGTTPYQWGGANAEDATLNALVYLESCTTTSFKIRCYDIDNSGVPAADVLVNYVAIGLSF
jgi:hypothetical protein